jgi:DNA-binding Xre family transcriptional regulator
MTAKLDYEWNLRKIMADRGLFSTTDLRPKLAERGVHLSASQIYRLVVEKPERLNLKALMALLDILDCRIDELIQPIPARAAGPGKKAVGHGDEPAEAGVGNFRPKRARVTPDSRS